MFDKISSLGIDYLYLLILRTHNEICKKVKEIILFIFRTDKI